MEFSGPKENPQNQNPLQMIHLTDKAFQSFLHFRNEFHEFSIFVTFGMSAEMVHDSRDLLQRFQKRHDLLIFFVKNFVEQR